ncbi:MAG: Rossmann-like and DUF2520 domain-containing protein [Bacteroidota bacterium]
MDLRIGFIGAGKVAWHLAPALAQSGNSVVQVISRSLTGAHKLADRLGCRYSDRISDLNKDIQILFLTVPDHALIDILNGISDYRGIVVHTSGTFSPMRFACQKFRLGGLYPLQTFTIGRPVDMSKVPVFIEGSDPEVTQIIRTLAKGFSSEIYELSCEDRKWIHLAAVWANNFSNHMLSQAFRILETRGQTGKILGPLIRETYNKALEIGPEKAQTGPASRQDGNTVGKHLEMLEGDPDLQKLYRRISESIGFKKNDNKAEGK